MRVKHVTNTTYHDGKLCKHSLTLGKVVKLCKHSLTLGKVVRVIN